MHPAIMHESLRPASELPFGVTHVGRPRENHLNANEDQNEGQGGLEEAEEVHETRDGEVHRAQAHDGEDV